MSNITPLELKCEYLVDPLGIDVTPRFSWILESSQRGEMQTAYQILVASSEEKLRNDIADKWDSKKVLSDQSVNVAYEGTSLVSAEKCYWKVRVWDKDDDIPTPYSNVASFEMSLLKESDWQGVWIGAEKKISSPLFRKEFKLTEEVKQARVYISGIGYYELYINGEKIGDHVLDPATTYYNNDQPFELHSRVLYVTYDVTDYLRAGKNVVAVMLGHGWYSTEEDIPPAPSFRDPYGDRPKLILQMNVQLRDGRRVNILSDETWKACPGPITYNDYCNGETYDARLEKSGWSAPAYDDSSWSKAQTVDAPDGELNSQLIPPIKVVKTIKPVRILNPEENVYIYDFGQNFSGWTRLRVSGPKGSKVRLIYAGRVYDDYKLDRRNNLYQSYQKNNLGAEQTDNYILKGKGTEVWEPRFTLHGFRYVELAGFPGTPSLINLEGRQVRSAVETSGSFTCSNPLLNQIHHNICWTFMSSFQGIPQDAAERDERVGWLGDPGFVAEDYIYNFNTASFWSKWLNDIKDSQKPDGSVPEVSPIHWRDIYGKLPAWQSSYPLFVWYLYQYYEDERVLDEHYHGLKKLVDFLSTKADNYVISLGLGDHMEPQNGFSSPTPKHTPVPLTSTAYYYYDAWILSQIAQILGKTEDAGRYSDLAEKIKNAFNQEFLNKDTNQYATGSQTSNALPLYLSMVPEGREKAVAQNIVNDVMIGHNSHLSTGIIGTNALAQVLSRYGWANVMYEIATQTTFPSWGLQVLKGATTLWENFEYSPHWSLNMKMFGSVEKFFYKDLAGISPSGPGYKQIAIKPHIVGDFTSASASIETVRGMASSSWEKTGESLALEVSIPVNSQAKVSVPKMGLEDITISEDGKTIWENGSYISGVAGITASSESAQYIAFDVGSGSYSFKLSGALKKPSVEYSNLELPESVKLGESFKVSAAVQNLSRYNLLVEVKLYCDKMVNSKVVPLACGKSRKVTFSTKLDEAGDHKVSIGSLFPRNVEVEQE